MLKDLIIKNRTYRRFYEEVKISEETLEELIELTRLTSTGRNVQALRYILSNEEQKNEKIFKNLYWAGYFKDWDGPKDGEKPSAYIVMLLDTALAKNCFWDHGLAAQSILLGAVEQGLGGCQFGSIDKENLRKDLDIDSQYEIMMVLALGKPKEVIVMDEMGPEGDFKYWRDEENLHHVPKRALEDLILK